MKSLPLESFTAFGDLLRYLRQREQLTQRELSIAVGYSESQINRLEHNLRLPEPSIVAAQFIPALHLEDEPATAARLIELAAQARGEPTPASFTFTRSTQREVADTAASFQQRRTNLPTQLTSFIGREREIVELTARVKTTRLLTLIGAGGVGKSRLAFEVAAGVLNDFPDGVWLVELASIIDPTLVPQIVTKVFDLREEPGRPHVEALITFLSRKHVLLVLDNCEHLIGACADLADRLLRACLGLHILATSREMLHVPGETTWRVPSLTTPDPAHLPPFERVLDYEAIQLFLNRAALARPDFAPTPHTAKAVAHICHRLDGIPLAIEMAAAQVSALSVNEIAAGLDNQLALLTSGYRTGLPRHQTLRATLDWSYNLLSPAEQIVLARLSVFAGGWTADAARAVCADESEARDKNLEARESGVLLFASDILPLLLQLVHKSLVVAALREGQTRYRLLETIRQYADEKLQAFDVDDQRGLHRRHFDFYLQLAEEAEPKLNGAEATRWLDELDAEHDNLRAAIEWAFASGETTFGLRLVAALADFWLKRNYHREEREQLLKALAKSDPAERTSLRATVLNEAFFVQWHYRNYDEAHTLLEEALSIGMELGDKRNIAQSLLHLQYEAFSQKDFTAARVFNEKALAAWRELGDKYKIGHTLSLGADLARFRGDYDQAQNWYEEAISILAELGEMRNRAGSLRRFGRVALELGDYARAASLCRQSLKLSMEAGDKRGATSSLATFGGLAVVQGQNMRAAKLFGAMEALLKRLDVLIMFANVYDYEDDLRALRAQLDEATFNAAWAEGQAMTMEQAFEYALSDEHNE